MCSYFIFPIFCNAYTLHGHGFQNIDNRTLVIRNPKLCTYYNILLWYTLGHIDARCEVGDKSRFSAELWDRFAILVK